MIKSSDNPTPDSFRERRRGITKDGSKVEKGFYVDKRDRLTRKRRWELLGEALIHEPNELLRTHSLS